MKLLPEIDPEIRGLIEEIVADPRSSIRLVPRKPLKSWFESGERVRARDVAGTKAEKHLIEAHREALAKLLCEAAMIAHWNAPTFARSAFREDGSRWDKERETQLWMHRAQGRTAPSRSSLAEVNLLRALLAKTRCSGVELAKASLGLVPTALALFLVAVNLPRDRLRTSVHLLRRLSNRRLDPELHPHVFCSLGARLAWLDQERAALDAYRAASAKSKNSSVGMICAFNLSCYLGDSDAARAEAFALERTLQKNDAVIDDAKGVLIDWWGTKDPGDAALARSAVARIRGGIPGVVETLCRAFGP